MLEALELLASPGPDFVDKINPILDEIDAIADSVETEDGRNAILDMTQVWDKSIAVVEAGDGDSDRVKNSLIEIPKTIESLGAYCEKAQLEK